MLFSPVNVNIVCDNNALKIYTYKVKIVHITYSYIINRENEIIIEISVDRQCSTFCVSYLCKSKY